MDFSYTKEYIIKNELIEDILEKMECEHIRESNNYFSASLPDKFNSDSRGTINIYKDTLISRIWSRGVSGDIFHLIAYVLELEDTRKALEWVNLEYKITQNSSNYSSPTNVNSWLKLLHSRRKKTGKNEPIDDSVLYKYDFVNAMPFLNDGISEQTQIEFEIGFDEETKRYTIPIRNEDGKLVGVKGRRIKKDAFGVCHSAMPDAKYMYIEEMDKSLELYGLYKTLDHILNEKKVYVFESEKSVMQAWDFGVKNCVAFSGSNISIQQASRLRQLNMQGVEIFMCWDSDKDLSQEDKETVDFMNREKSVMGIEFNLVRTWEMEHEYSSPTDYGKNIFLQTVEKYDTINAGNNFMLKQEEEEESGFSFELEELL